jgi:hypothetical protein
MNQLVSEDLAKNGLTKKESLKRVNVKKKSVGEDNVRNN